MKNRQFIFAVALIMVISLSTFLAGCGGGGSKADEKDKDRDTQRAVIANATDNASQSAPSNLCVDNQACAVGGQCFNATPNVTVTIEQCATAPTVEENACQCASGKLCKATLEENMTVPTNWSCME